MGKPPLDVNLLLERIAKHHGDTVTLDISTYKGTAFKARFIDKDYGEWWTAPGNVQNGTGHRKRADKLTSQITREKHVQARNKQTQALLAIQDVVHDLYAIKLMSYQQVRDHLILLGHNDLTVKGVAQFIRNLGINRTTKVNHFRSPKKCEICEQTFIARSGKARWCNVCVPDKTGYAKRFGFSNASYIELIAKQNNACAICLKPFDDTPSTQIHLDHCHITNTVRGVLCVNCNHGLGCFLDDPIALRSAATYLETCKAKFHEPGT